jgi:hypothetical protein
MFRAMSSTALALVILTTAHGAAFAEPLEPPTIKTVLRIEQEKNGACAEIRAGRSETRPALVMTDICHGWSASGCGDMLFVEGRPVVEAQGQVLFVEDDKAVDLIPLIDRAIDRRWPGDKHLHLAFGTPYCDGGRLVAPFSGSHLKRGTTGSAAALEGRVLVVSPDSQIVQLGKP